MPTPAEADGDSGPDLSDPDAAAGDTLGAHAWPGGAAGSPLRREGNRDDSDLFRPSVELNSRQSEALTKPWRTESMFVPAFFGGPVAVTILAALNARRLGARSAVPWLLAVGVAAFIGLVAFMTIPADPPATARVVIIVAGLVVYGVQAWILRGPSRLHQLRSGEYDSLWAPGFAAIVISVVITLGVLLVLGAYSENSVPLQ